MLFEAALVKSYKVSNLLIGGSLALETIQLGGVVFEKEAVMPEGEV